jgi:hypothetical protein
MPHPAAEYSSIKLKAEEAGVEYRLAVTELENHRLVHGPVN